MQFECSKWCIIEGNVNVPASLVHREAVFRSTFFLHATLRSLTSWWPTSPLPFPSLKFQSCYFSPCQLTCTIYFIYILLFVNIFFSCPQLSLGCCCLFVCVCVFFFNYYYFESSASCITCFSTHSAQTWVPFCFDQRSSLDHPIFVSVLSSVLALTHQPWWWGQQFPLEISVHVCKTSWHPCKDKRLRKVLYMYTVCTKNFPTQSCNVWISAFCHQKKYLKTSRMFVYAIQL